MSGLVFMSILLDRSFVLPMHLNIYPLMPVVKISYNCDKFHGSFTYFRYVASHRKVNNRKEEKE